MIKKHPLYLFADFRKLFAGRLVSAIGDKFFQIALIWWALGQSQEGKSKAGLIMAATFAPIVLFGPFMGALADKYDKKRAMLAADLLRAIFAWFLFLLLFFEILNFPLALILVFCISSFAPLFESCAAAALVKLTSKKTLSAATAVDASSSQISSLIGSAAGAATLGLIGIKGAFLANAAAYMISFSIIFFINTELSDQQSQRYNHAADLREGFNYLKKEKEIFYLVIFFAFLNFFASPIFILIPMIVKFILCADIKWLAIFEAFFAAGMMSVSAALGFKEKYGKPAAILSFSILTAGLFFMTLGFSKDKYISLLFLTLLGAALSLGNVVILAYFQNKVADKFKGRFFSLITAISFAIMPASFAFNGFMAEKISIEKTIIFNATVMILISAAPIFISKLSNKNIQPNFPS